MSTKPIAFLFGLLLATATFAAETVTIGSKKFTESVILGEAARQLIEAEGWPARHRAELGGTRVLWNALLAGDIDIYPEYTGTLRHEIFAGSPRDARIESLLAEHGVRATEPLGFNNTYALGMRRERAARLGIRRVSDLRAHPELVFGFSNEFMDRADGWPGLRARYGLPQPNVRGLDHDLAYRGLAAGSLDVIDLYSTDAEIEHYDLAVLEDELGYFPDYRAVFLFRADLAQRSPEAVAALRRIEGRVDAAAMSAMNARAKLEGVAEMRVAAQFVSETLGVAVAIRSESTFTRFWLHTREHLALVGLSLSAAVLVAIPLGVLAWLRPAAGQLILGVAGTIQTIPALALLVFMIPLLGIGGPPAVVALFLYSLLPIIRNTHAGLHDVPPPVRESADALGLPFAARLRFIDLPLASRSILAGIKISAVINVGTATLGALIGAGGYGQPILTGIRLDDVNLILQGAVPAAALALLVQGLFELLERKLVPEGLRVGAR